MPTKKTTPVEPKKPTTKAKISIVKIRPTQKELKQATQAALKQYQTAVKKLAKR